ncbi:MAG: type II secretion system protein M [Thermodesulfobacteriota bacterium]
MNFWQNMNKREKIFSAGGAALLLLFMAYLLVIHPLSRELTKMQKSIPLKKEELAWMKTAALQAGQLAKTRPANTPASSPLKVIDLTAGQYGLSAKLRRVDPGENDEIKVWFEDLVFIDLMKFIRDLHENHGIGIVSFTAESLDSPGVVNARITFKAGRT